MTGDKGWPDLRYDPWSESDVNDMARKLGDLTGTEWLGHHVENSQIPGVATFTTYRKSSTGRWVVAGVMLLAEDAIKADNLRQYPLSAAENSKNLTENPEALDVIDGLPPLDRADAGSSEEFSHRVAAHYRAWAAAVPNPVAAMSAHYGVNARTVHTWIREARLRGELPPAGRKRKG